MRFAWHHVPGRLRLRLAALKGDEQAALRACAAARAIAGVVDAQANRATGSLVIYYRPERLAPAGLWAALCERELVSGPCPLDSGAAAVGGGEPIHAAFTRAVLDRLAQTLASALVGALL